MSLERSFEEVFTVTDYWDEPLEGIANCGGRPHFYQRIFDVQKDEYSDLFRLAPISEAAFQLAMEDWATWQRWESAFRTGATSRDTHPALPRDRVRHDEIQRDLRTTLVVAENCLIKRGEFQSTSKDSMPCGALRDFRVRWSDLE